MKMSLQSRNMLVTALLGGGAVAYVFLLFLPMQKQTVQLREDLRMQRQFVEQSITLAGTMASVEQDLQAARDFAGAWRESAPRASQLAPAFGAITRCATDAGVEVQQFDPQPVVAMETVSRAPLSLSCSGTFHQIYYFLELLESQPQTIWVSDLLLSGSDAGEGKMTCELTLVVFADNREGSH
jgi:Tfp pilus assembly protein PilO